MRNLVIYPSFFCPFACNFCMNKNRNSSMELLDLDKAKLLLDKNISKFDQIIISGGEPMCLDKSYYNNLISLLQTYSKKIIVESYPFSVANYRDDVDYKLSYDFMIRPRAIEAWENLLSFKKKFDLVITLSPLMFKYHPNALISKLALLPNINSVEFVPYIKNECSQYDITINNSLKKYQSMVLNCQLNIPFEIVNKTKNIKQPIEYIDICLFPDGELYTKKFNDKGIMIYSKATQNDIKIPEILKYPSEIKLYGNNDE